MLHNQTYSWRNTQKYIFRLTYASEKKRKETVLVIKKTFHNKQNKGEISTDKNMKYEIKS